VTKKAMSGGKGDARREIRFPSTAAEIGAPITGSSNATPFGPCSANQALGGFSLALEPLPKDVESDESFVIPYVAPESRSRGAVCGSLNIVVLLISVAFAIRAI
jgi:hypothetical protein